MKEFDEPMVTVSQEHFDQLQECRSIVEDLWRQFGPYKWPEAFRLPRGKTFADLDPHGHEFRFYQIRSRLGRLMEFDDSE